MFFQKDKILILICTITGFTMITCLIVYSDLYLDKVASTINLDDSNVPEIRIKAENCSSPYLENEIISFFKENDKFYKHISYKSVDSVKIIDKTTIIKDEEKYLCKGTIEIKSTTNGFKPLKYEENNDYYQKVLLNEKKIRKYNLYKVPVFYISQILEGKNEFKIEKMDIGEFECTGYCEPVYKFEKKPKKLTIEKTKQKQEEIKSETQINQEINKSNTDEEKKKEEQQDKKKNIRFIKWLKKRKTNL